MLTPMEQRNEQPFPLKEKKKKKREEEEGKRIKKEKYNQSFLPCWSLWFLWVLCTVMFREGRLSGVQKPELRHCLQLQKLMKQYLSQV